MKAAAERLQRVRQVQADSEASVQRSLGIVEGAQQLGAETAVTMKKQTEQLKDIYEDVQAMESSLQKAEKIVSLVRPAPALARRLTMRAAMPRARPCAHAVKALLSLTAAPLLCTCLCVPVCVYLSLCASLCVPVCEEADGAPRCHGPHHSVPPRPDRRRHRRRRRCQARPPSSSPPAASLPPCPPCPLATSSNLRGSSPSLHASSRGECSHGRRVMPSRDAGVPPRGGCLAACRSCCCRQRPEHTGGSGHVALR